MPGTEGGLGGPTLALRFTRSPTRRPSGSRATRSRRRAGVAAAAEGDRQPAQPALALGEQLGGEPRRPRRRIEANPPSRPAAQGPRQRHAAATSPGASLAAIAG